METIANNIYIDKGLVRDPNANKALKGSWYNWKRYYVIQKAEKDQEGQPIFAIVALNLIDRFKNLFVNQFKKEFPKCALLSKTDLNYRLNHINTVSQRILNTVNESKESEEMTPKSEKVEEKELNEHIQTDVVDSKPETVEVKDDPKLEEEKSAAAEKIYEEFFVSDELEETPPKNSDVIDQEEMELEIKNAINQALDSADFKKDPEAYQAKLKEDQLKRKGIGMP